MMKNLKLFSVALILLACGVSTASANLIVNGVDDISDWHRSATTVGTTFSSNAGTAAWSTGTWTGTASFSYASLWGYFDKVSIVDGETIKLKAEVRLASTPNFTFAYHLRFGLGNSQGSKFEADATGNNPPALRDDPVYAAMLGSGTAADPQGSRYGFDRGNLPADPSDYDYDSNTGRSWHRYDGEAPMRRRDSFWYERFDPATPDGLNDTNFHDYRLELTRIGDTMEMQIYIDDVAQGTARTFSASMSDEAYYEFDMIYLNAPYAGFDYEFRNLEVTVVPEPATMMLLGLGSTAVLYRRRRRCD